jgi:hypothetical protein
MLLLYKFPRAPPPDEKFVSTGQKLRVHPMFILVAKLFIGIPR